MSKFIRNVLNFFSGIVSVCVYIVLITEFVFILTLSDYNFFSKIHYFLFVFIFLDVLIRLVIRPLNLSAYVPIAIGMLSVIPILQSYQLIDSFNHAQIYLEQILLFCIAITRVNHLSFLFQPLRHHPTQTFIGGFVFYIIRNAFAVCSGISCGKCGPY